MTSSYAPKPVDTSSVEVPPALLALAERLAEHVHDLWAAQRLSDGWTYGPERDDSRRLHPGLVPYGELSQSEKEYDRRISLETVKAIIALGFRISSPAP